MKMQNRRKRVRRGDGSVYRTNGKRERWKSQMTGTNRRVQSSIDRTKQGVWRKKEKKEKKEAKKESVKK